MRRALLIWCLLLAGLACIAQSERVSAFWQSRDSNYNIAISGGLPSTTTFDPVNLGIGAVLSNGNLTTTTSGGSSALIVACSVAFDSTGKYYVELSIVQNYSNPGQTSLGVGNSSAPLTGNTGIGFDGAADSVGMFGNGATVYLNYANVGTASTFAMGDILSIALDAGNQLIWFRTITGGVTPGNWNNSALAVPATGTGGISISAITSPYYVLAAGQFNNSIVTTANFGATSYASFYSTVTGFGNW